MTVNKESGRKRRHNRIRKRITGTKDKPRMSVHRSINNLAVQLIDDIEGVTLCAVSTMDKGYREKQKTGGNVKSAVILGELIAKAAQSKGIKKVVFDRSGYLYHGRIKALADSARKAGLEF
ncbi:MAG: 50S ribosomal protein L18 [Candidatus Omnitrophica bacterium]|nr:50S ribosomal protein L18 [Candidatus Omnitrophota bacterium]